MSYSTSTWSSGFLLFLMLLAPAYGAGRGGPSPSEVALARSIFHRFLHRYPTPVIARHLASLSSDSVILSVDVTTGSPEYFERSTAGATNPNEQAQYFVYHLYQDGLGIENPLRTQPSEYWWWVNYAVANMENGQNNATVYWFLTVHSAPTPNSSVFAGTGGGVVVGSNGTEYIPMGNGDYVSSSGAVIVSIGGGNYVDSSTGAAYINIGNGYYESNGVVYTPLGGGYYVDSNGVVYTPL